MQLKPMFNAKCIKMIRYSSLHFIWRQRSG